MNRPEFVRYDLISWVNNFWWGQVEIFFVGGGYFEACRMHGSQLSQQLWGGGERGFWGEREPNKKKEKLFVKHPMESSVALRCSFNMIYLTGGSSVLKMNTTASGRSGWSCFSNSTEIPFSKLWISNVWSEMYGHWWSDKVLILMRISSLSKHNISWDEIEEDLVDMSFTFRLTPSWSRKEQVDHQVRGNLVRKSLIKINLGGKWRWWYWNSH